MIRQWATAAAVQIGRALQGRAPGLIGHLAPALPLAFPRTRGIPWTPLPVPLSRATVALVTSSGLHPAGSLPFRTEALLGDPSFRVIVGDARPSDLLLSPVQYDRRPIERDPNVAFPLERLSEWSREALIGRVAPRHLAFYGYCLSLERLLHRSVPEALALLREDQVHAAVLIPACIVCHQTIPLIQRALEEGGLATVSLSFLPQATSRMRPPRALVVDSGCGAPLGRPGDRPRQRGIVRLLLRALAEMEAPGEIWMLDESVPRRTSLPAHRRLRHRI